MAKNSTKLKTSFWYWPDQDLKINMLLLQDLRKEDKSLLSLVTVLMMLQLLKKLM